LHESFLFIHVVEHSLQRQPFQSAAT
jgi:hypothetical protein